MARSTTMKTKVTRKGQTVVPAPIRKQLNIGANSNLIWTFDERIITVIPVPEDPIRSLRGMTDGMGLRKALILRRKEDEKKR